MKINRLKFLLLLITSFALIAKTKLKQKMENKGLLNYTGFNEARGKQIMKKIIEKINFKTYRPDEFPESDRFFVKATTTYADMT